MQAPQFLELSDLDKPMCVALHAPPFVSSGQTVNVSSA